MPLPQQTTQQKRSSLWIGLLVLWASVIFVTSCSFIDRDVFIRFISHYLPAGEWQARWASLWIFGGIVIVKGYHMTEFALLYCLLYLAQRRGLHRPIRQATSVSYLGCALYAALDEWHQTFVPGRGGTVIDVGIDLMGITLAAIILFCRHAKRHEGVDTVAIRRVDQDTEISSPERKGG